MNAVDLPCRIAWRPHRVCQNMVERLCGILWVQKSGKGLVVSLNLVGNEPHLDAYWCKHQGLKEHHRVPGASLLLMIEGVSGRSGVFLTGPLLLITPTNMPTNQNPVRGITEECKRASQTCSIPSRSIVVWSFQQIWPQTKTLPTASLNPAQGIIEECKRASQPVQFLAGTLLFDHSD